MDKKRVIQILIFGLAILLWQCGPNSARKLKEQQMVKIPAGTFLMGSGSGVDQGPPHKVSVDDFLMDIFEVTNRKYQEFCDATDRALPEYWGMGVYKSGSEYPEYPVIGVSWNDAVDYADWVGKRLPTEAEWEYAARSGRDDAVYPNGETIDTLQANISFKNIRRGPVPVGSYEPNEFGLYDMTGNALEWVLDYYQHDYYSESPKNNPQGPEEGRFRIIRGGGWHSGPGCCKVYNRNALQPNWADISVGFRCVKSD